MMGHRGKFLLFSVWQNTIDLVKNSIGKNCKKTKNVESTPPTPIFPIPTF